ncbi:MAG: crossover junction endodeoxyribonuclease RuvC [Deltaproteobacteria bacterium]|nr:crossover junction endodeoxyribonuclease RuvC [Deltaproteobacteria bacterium]
MLILGLDPGSRHTGFGFVESRGSRVTLLDQGAFSPPAKAPLPERLAFLGEKLAEILDRHPPDVVALESPFHGINSRSLIVLAQARGALIAELGKRQLEMFEFSPSEVKVAVTGNGRAGKEQVARMVSILLGTSGRNWSSDVSDALAIAICCSRRYRMDRVVAFHKSRK